MKIVKSLLFLVGVTVVLTGRLMADVAGQVDELAEQVKGNDGGEIIVTVDHRRLAAAERVPMHRVF